MATKKKIPKWVWVTAYIDKSLTHLCGYEVESSETFTKLKWFIPVVRVLDKKFKGKSHYSYVPMLFNYGFFRIPGKKAANHKYLNQLKDEVSCISGWVKNYANAKTKSLRKIRKGVDESIPIALATQEEIDHLLKVQQANDIYSGEELDKVQEGDIIILKEYPFAGLAAKVLKIDFEKRKVLINLWDDGMMSGPLLNRIKLDFEHVFFTIYKSEYTDDLMGHVSLDEVGSYNRNHTMFRDNETE